MATYNPHTKFEHRMSIGLRVMLTTDIHMHTDIFSIPLFWTQDVPKREETQKKNRFFLPNTCYPYVNIWVIESKKLFHNS